MNLSDFPLTVQPALKWFAWKPFDPGFYWMRRPGSPPSKYTVIKVSKGFKYERYWGHEFAGPIPLPMEVLR